MFASLTFALIVASATPQDPPAPAAPQRPAEPAVEFSVPEFANATCPIMGKPASASLFTDTEYGRIYVCCKPCIKKVRNQAEKSWKTAYPVVKPVANTECPITGKAVDAKVPAVTVQGSSISVCCSDCAPKVTASTQIALAKANDPKLVDLENRGCPITGEETDANTIAIIDGTIVRFATPKARSAAKADPKGTLEKARTLRQQELDGTLKLTPHPEPDAKPDADRADDADDADAADSANQKAKDPSKARKDS
ncbi:MAG: hypothetical protein JNL94_09555 [Planctomycetes bacterium]|nr:hypothetical protein [Planctomycetota bacterium]